MTDVYTADMHHRRSAPVRDLVRLWCENNRLAYRWVREIRVRNRGERFWTFEVEVIERDAAGRVKVAGQGELATTTITFVGHPPEWWPGG
jgi:hypothetical protein